ncbi:MAG: hypothetical protein COA45_03645 [Zetaproteobacteria bacterium]|nr:MAG: hypothetical protein COA45_03645 [Zetaproteobacteria bacterium]
MGNFFTKTSSQVPINGDGISEQEKIVNTFARQADLSLSDAMGIVAGEDIAARQGKKDAFENNIIQTHGSMKRFRDVLEQHDTCEA